MPCCVGVPWPKRESVFLSKVHVRNFRNFRDFEVRLAPGLNVLVGENNIGKTNLLDAVRVALGSAASTGDPIRIGRDDRHRLADGSYVDEPIQAARSARGATTCTSTRLGRRPCGHGHVMERSRTDPGIPRRNDSCFARRGAVLRVFGLACLGSSPRGLTRSALTRDYHWQIVGARAAQ